MTAQELRELDAFIAEHVMGWKVTLGSFDQQVCKDDKGALAYINFNPTTDTTAAMEVLKKCAVRTEVKVRHNGETWEVFGSNSSSPISSDTLELAICLFSKKLFDQA